MLSTSEKELIRLLSGIFFTSAPKTCLGDTILIISPLVYLYWSISKYKNFQKQKNDKDLWFFKIGPKMKNLGNLFFFKNVFIAFIFVH
jgi:hypothetical protein